MERYLFIFAASSLTFLGILLSLSGEASAQDTNRVVQILDMLSRPDTIIQILIGSTLITTVVNIVWFLVSSTLTRISHWLNVRRTSYAITVSPRITKEKYAELDKLAKGFFCLLVRWDGSVHR